MSTTDDRHEAAQRGVPDMMLATPYVGGLGLVFDAYRPDDVTVRLPFRPDLTNDGAAYHGGVVAAAMDTAGAAAAWSAHDFSKGVRGSTVSLSLQYVAACRSDDLVCRARTVRRARELVFTEIEASDTSGRPVAHALQTYRFG